MYRMTRHTPLSTGQKYGDIIRDGDLSPATIERMLASGTLNRITTPPLSELANWGKRSELLAAVGIITIEDMSRANAEELAGKLKKPAHLIQKWQDEAITWLRPETQPERG